MERRTSEEKKRRSRDERKENEKEREDENLSNREKSTGSLFLIRHRRAFINRWTLATVNAVVSKQLVRLPFVFALIAEERGGEHQVTCMLD